MQQKTSIALLVNANSLSVVRNFKRNLNSFTETEKHSVIIYYRQSYLPLLGFISPNADEISTRHRRYGEILAMRYASMLGVPAKSVVICNSYRQAMRSTKREKEFVSIYDLRPSSQQRFQALRRYVRKVLDATNKPHTYVFN